MQKQKYYKKIVLLKMIILEYELITFFIFQKVAKRTVPSKKKLF